MDTMLEQLGIQVLILIMLEKKQDFSQIILLIID